MDVFALDEFHRQRIRPHLGGGKAAEGMNTMARAFRAQRRRVRAFARSRKRSAGHKTLTVGRLSMVHILDHMPPYLL